MDRIRKTIRSAVPDDGIAEREVNYVEYEYRNSDDLCAFAYDEKTINTPTLSEIAEKYHAATKSGLGNYIKTFPCFHIEECVNYIKEDMIEGLSKQKK